MKETTPMIKTKKVHLFLSIVLTSLLIFSFIGQAFADQAVIKTETLNVRDKPGLAGEVITQIQKNETYPILKKDGEWTLLKLSVNRTGWVASWLIEEKSTNVNEKSKVRSTVDSLRVRSGPGVNFQIVGALSKGKVVEQIDENGNWTQILFNNEKAWVSSAYMEKASNKEQDIDVQDKKKKSIKINATILNVRERPILTSPILGKLTKNTIINYTEMQDGWYSIDYENKVGWVSGDFVELVEDDQSSTKKEAPPQNKPASNSKMVVDASILNMRSDPTLDGKVISKLKRGTVVSVISQKTEWSEIQYENQTGWVSSDFLMNDDKQQTQPTVTILNDGTNIRKGPSTNTEVVSRANQGDSFTIIEKERDWYYIELKNGEKAYIAGWIVQVNGSIEKVQRPGVAQYLKGKTIVIDPGHGGKDSGTIGISGTLEKDLTYRTAKLAADKLTAAGANVILTRKGDRYITLNYRVSLSHYYNADAFLSLHYDSTRYQNVNGISTFYYNESTDLPLATALHKELTKGTGLDDRKVKSGNFHVLRENKRPSVLIELGFLSNKKEEWYVNTNDYQEKAASAIYRGLVNYFK